MISIKINGEFLNFEVDSSASVTVILNKIFKQKLGREIKLESKLVKLNPGNGH